MHSFIALPNSCSSCKPVVLTTWRWDCTPSTRWETKISSVQRLLVYSIYWPWLVHGNSRLGGYPSATFRIFRHRGKGAIRAGEVVAFYYPKDVKWMTCNSKWCFKNTCPGNPTIFHGMESSEKWEACSDNVFKIYARGRKLGERLRRNDAILLYSLRYSKWVSVYGTWIAQGTCPDSGRPPASSKYDTCYKPVFELWKQYYYVESICYSSVAWQTCTVVITFVVGTVN